MRGSCSVGRIISRFRHDCEACFVPLEATDAELSEAADTLMKANAPQGEVHVVTFATPGPLGVYTGEGNGLPTLGMVTYPVSESRYRPFFTEGAVLIPVPMTVLLPTVKHRSRMNWHVADHTAKRDSGVPHALAVNVIDGAIHETSIANVLAVTGGVVVSPPRDSVLHGISLKVTRELCNELGIGFRDESIRADGPFTELMICGTGFGLAGVKRLGDRIFDSPGPLTRRLVIAWSALTGGG